MRKYLKFLFVLFLVMISSLPLFVFGSKNNDQKEIVIIDSGIEFQVQTKSKNVSQILKDFNIKIDDIDLVFPSMETELNSGGRIIIKRAIPVKIIYFGQVIETKTWEKTVGDLLKQEKIILTKFGRINFKLDAEIIPNMEIIIKKPSSNFGRENSLKEQKHSDIRGLATWYGPGFYGRKTACGEIFSGKELTAAHRTLPCGSMVRVTNLNNGSSIVVRINDRGPYGNAIIDLSPKSKEAIGMGSKAPVKLEVLNNN